MIFTFYSYKGGVGRSLALAHVAYAFAERGLRVLAVDFDLEAPGLERYCFAGNDGVQSARDHAGLVDLIGSYRRALTSPAEFKAASFRDWKQFILPVRDPVNDLGGRLDLMTAGRRGSREHLRDYSLTVRTFDWPDFFHNWNGDGFFKWLRDEWTRSDIGYDVVLVDSRTGVTEMGGVCAYQLADVAVLLCAPNYQNLDGTVDVARDFTSPGVLALRGGRPLQMLAVPTRLDPEHPARDEFLKRFAALLGPPGFGPEVDVSYAELALPYLPPFAVSEPIVGGPEAQASPAEREAFAKLKASLQRLAEGLTLFAPGASRLGAQREAALAALRGHGRVAATPLHADTSRRSAGYDFFVDYGAEDGVPAHELARLLRAANFEVFIDSASLAPGSSWAAEIERALDYSACVLVCFGNSSTSGIRTDLLMRARASARPITLAPVLLPNGSADAPHSFGLEIYQSLDLRQGVEAAALASLVASRRPRPEASSDADPAAPANPYRGPLPYGEDDARLLFGRDEQIAQVLALLDQSDAVWIEGAAKVGKTSLVMAGVLPALRARTASSSAPPRIEVHDASQVAPWPRWREPASAPAGDDKGAAAAAAQVIVIDHVDSFVAGELEFSRDERRSSLLDLLLARSPARRLIVIGRGVGLADASDKGGDFAGLPNPVPRFSLTRLQGDALRQAITEPALKASHLLENGLAERLVESAGDAHSAMLQIQLALASLWELRREGWLTNRALDGLDHLAGVFKRHLQARLAALDSADRDAARVLFKALCTPEPSGGLVAWPLPWSQARTPAAIDSVGPERLRDLLAADGLLDLWRGANALEVALVRGDARIYFDDAALVADSEFVAWRGRLHALLAHWTGGGRHPSALLVDSALVETSRWHALHGDQLTAAERDFIESSLDASLLRAPSPDTARIGAPAAAVAPELEASEQQPLLVDVVNGDLRFVDGPLMLGHYRSSRLTGTEAVASAQLAGALARALASGVYPDQTGTHMVFGNEVPDRANPLARARPATVVVIGLGEEGRLRSVDLIHSVRQGVYAYAESRRNLVGGGAGLSLSVTLIGSGALGVSAGSCAQLVAQGVREANQQAFASGAPGITRLRFVELYHDRACEAWRALRDQAIGQRLGLRLGAGVGAAPGALRRSLASSYRGVAHEIVTALTIVGPTGEPAIAFTLSTRRAHGEVRAQVGLAPLVRELVAKASGNLQVDPQVGRTLYDLLIPVEVAPLLGGVHETVIELDPGTAALPWELLDGDADSARGDFRPWAIRSKLLRKLRTASFRPQVSDSYAGGAILVIGEPLVDAALYPRLPGARAEAFAVAKAFAESAEASRSKLVQVLAIDNNDAQAIINRLFERPYRIVHAAGHGMPGARGGIVLSGQTFLGADEIRAMRSVPELVFINCCHSPAVVGELLAPYDRVEFAANFAEGLIVSGVRCVVVAGWAVQDVASEVFAASFYRALLDGARYMDAVGAARNAAWQAEPRGSTWGAFQCYGDPDWTLRTGPDDRAHLPATSVAEFVDIASPVDLALALETIATRVRFADGRSQIDKIRFLEDSYASSWGGMGAVAEAYALAYAECRDVDKAVDWYRRALAAHDGSASFQVAEQLGNQLARRGAQAADESQARRDLEGAIAHLERLVAVQPTPAREALLASAWKRYALRITPAGAAKGEAAIRAVALHYGNAERMARAGDLPELYLVSTNAISAELRLAFLDRRVPKLDASRLRATERALATTAAERPDFWSAAAQIEFRLLVASAEQRLARVSAGAIAQFRELKTRVPAPAMWDSVHAEARFTLEPYARMASAGERRAAETVLEALRELATS